MIKRALMGDLLVWVAAKRRQPLLLCGARQVGKSHLVRALGQEHFASMVEVNFELMPQARVCFQSLDPQKITDQLTLVMGQSVIPGETLLFLDEIQDCPEAIQSLRYFKEMMPDLHVIGAGSLLEWVLNHADFRMPVGRVAWLYLYPISFREYLAELQPDLDRFLSKVERDIPKAIHERLSELMRRYAVIGGYPEAVMASLEGEGFEVVQRVQSHLLASYRSDLGHVATRACMGPLKACFDAIPALVGEQVKYSRLDAQARSRDLKPAIACLEDMGVVHRIQATHAQGLPLEAGIQPKRFKLNWADCGLLKRANQLEPELAVAEDALLVSRGGLAEQLVGQELLAYAPAWEKARLYFWARDGGERAAEVDYLVVVDGQVIPVEVKAGKTGGLKSLHRFMAIHDSPLGIRVSSQPLSLDRGILSLPFYLLGEYPRLVRYCLRGGNF